MLIFLGGNKARNMVLNAISKYKLIKTTKNIYRLVY